MNKPSIEELEELLKRGEELDIELQPNGEIRAVPKGTAHNADVKPLMFKQVFPTHY